MSTTKTQVRADWRYVRECIRQAEVALKKDDVEELVQDEPRHVHKWPCPAKY
jgi:hypothetical protein